MLASILVPVLSLLAGDAATLPAPSASAVLEALEGRVRELRLQNGWTVLMVPTEGPPLVSIETVAAVGWVDEQPGETGLATLLARLAFQGSDRVGSRDWTSERVVLEELEARHDELLRARGEPSLSELARTEAGFLAARASAATLADEGEFRRLLEDAGAAGLGAEAGADSTRFSVASLPANRLELWAWLEAERFRRPVLRGFYRKRDALVEERRATIEDDAFGTLYEQLRLVGFQTHPYRHPPLGLPGDLAAQSRTSAARFFREHYGADRLVTALVGSLSVDETAALVERYLAGVPAGAERDPAPRPEPVQQGERRARVVFPGAPPALAMAWRVPSLADPDGPATEAALRLLAGARSTPVRARLLGDEPLALEVSLQRAFPGERADHLALVVARAADGVPPEDLERAIAEEVDRLQRSGPGDDELAGVKRQALAELLADVADRSALARRLACHEAETGDWRDGVRRVERLDEVRPADVQRVLRRYFRARGRTVVTLLPEAER